MKKPNAGSEVWWRYVFPEEQGPSCWMRAKVEHLKPPDLIKLIDLTHAHSAETAVSVSEIEWRYA